MRAASVAIASGPTAHLFWLSDVHSFDLCPDALSPGERLRFERFLAPARRQEFLAGRLLLRHALRAWNVPWEALRLEPSGRPALEVPDLDVSLAHAGGHVLVALARGGRVGVDVEVWRRRQRSLMDAFFHADERAWMADSVPRLHALWTVKEAALKALGEGLCGDPLRVHVSPWDGRVEIRDARDGFAACWRHEGAGHSAAAVLLSTSPPARAPRVLVERVAPEDLGATLRTPGATA
jgi:4'-phosphopantetheinyl transferase